MADEIYEATQAGKEALETLRLMLMDEDVTDGARATAAKTLLERFVPKEDAESRKREADERAAAIAEAKCLLAEFELAKSAGFHEPPALDQECATLADNAADNGA